jgi:hypothetical protein
VVRSIGRHQRPTVHQTGVTPLQLLALIAKKEEIGLRLGRHHYECGFPFGLVTLLQDFLDLYRRGIWFAPNVLVSDGSTVSLPHLLLEGPGDVLYRLMELHRIDTSELLPIAEILKATD